MDCVFCTLFDTNYLDKGITLYQSMLENITEFRLYVFAFDDDCYDILQKEKYPNLVPVSLKEFETEELLKVKNERTKAEYCWTCTPWIIKHVLDCFNEDICTYIDADMQFFSSPQFIFDKMRKDKKSIIIVPHRFGSEKAEKEAHNKVGSFCVEFNTFVNDENGNMALTWWAERCLEWCYYSIPGTTEWYGDQKYLNVFPELFDGVMICNHFGIGLAPWNIKLVDYFDTVEHKLVIRVKNSREVFPVVLYHFENVSFISKHIMHASSRTNSKKLFDAIYNPYITKLLNNRSKIERKYGIQLSRERRVVTKNPFMKLYQKYISPIRRIKHFRDLFWVR